MVLKQLYQPSGWSLSNCWVCNGWIRGLLRSQLLSCSCRTNGLCPIIGHQWRPGPGQDGGRYYRREEWNGKKKQGIPVLGAQLLLIRSREQDRLEGIQCTSLALIVKVSSEWALLPAVPKYAFNKETLEAEDGSYLYIGTWNSHRFYCWKRLLPFTHVDKSYSTCCIGENTKPAGGGRVVRFAELLSNKLRLWSPWCNLRMFLLYSSPEARITETVGKGLDINYVQGMVRMFDLGMSPRHTVMNSYTCSGLCSNLKSAQNPYPSCSCISPVTSLLFLLGFFTIYKIYMVIWHTEFIPDSF